MAAYILILLFSVGVLGQHQPPLAMKFRQDTSDIPYRSPSDLLGQLAVKTNQADSVIASDSKVGRKQIALKSEVKTSDEDTEYSDSGCVFPFVSVNNQCYFFSSEQKTFADAEAYCETLSHGHSYEVSLAMMDYDRYEDQALLNTVTERSNTFWIGGSTLDGVNWSWIDDRPLSLALPLWYWGEPNTATNKCLVAEVSTNGNNVRTYLKDSDCTTPLNFICQTRFSDEIFEFRKIGNDYYFKSDEVGLPNAHWQEARDFCQDLLVPVGYYADLAVLGMPQQDDYDLMINFFPSDGTGSYNAWIGAVDENNDCTFHYIDNRTLPISSSYWVYDEPTCQSSKYVYLYYYVTYNQVYLADTTESATYPFICQMFKDD